MQDLPNKLEAITKVWTSLIQNSNLHPLGGSMCRPYWSIHPQRQRRLVNRLYGSHHDRPRFQLARTRGVTNNHPSDDQEGQW